MINSKNEISLVNKAVVLKKIKKYQFFSIMPLGKYATVSIKGSRYELVNKKIWQGQTIGISNEIMNQNCSITVHKGKLILIRSKD